MKVFRFDLRQFISGIVAILICFQYCADANSQSVEEQKSPAEEKASQPVDPFGPDLGLTPADKAPPTNAELADEIQRLRSELLQGLDYQRAQVAPEFRRLAETERELETLRDKIARMQRNIEPDSPDPIDAFGDPQGDHKSTFPNPQEKQNEQSITAELAAIKSSLNDITEKKGNAGLWLQIAFSFGILGFGVFVLIHQSFLIRESKEFWNSAAVIRFNLLSLLIFSGLFLVVAGFGELQIASMMGLLGTIAGYLLGKDTVLGTEFRPQDVSEVSDSEVKSADDGSHNKVQASTKHRSEQKAKNATAEKNKGPTKT